MAVIIGGNVLNIFITPFNNKDIPFLGDVLYAVKYERIIAHNEPTIVANIAIKKAFLYTFYKFRIIGHIYPYHSFYNGTSLA